MAEILVHRYIELPVVLLLSCQSFAPIKKHPSYMLSLYTLREKNGCAYSCLCKQWVHHLLKQATSKTKLCQAHIVLTLQLLP